MAKILLCQTPNSQLAELGPALLKKGYQVRVFGDFQALGQASDTEIRELLDLGHIDLAIVDMSCATPEMALCQALRDCHSNLPIILLVGQKMAILSEYKQLTCGNVLRLPFTSRKVINRAKKLLDSRYGSVLQSGTLTLNLETRCVYRGDMFNRLTPRQARLLEVFMRNAGQTLTRRFLMETVWDTDYMGDTRTLDVHVRWLRERIEEDPSSPCRLRTVRGVGYRFGLPDEE
jgi:DNA-binding response OmpR family regulator